MMAVVLSLMIGAEQYKCVRWIWWWDSNYQYKITHCIEWKKVEKK